VTGEEEGDHLAKLREACQAAMEAGEHDLANQLMALHQQHSGSTVEEDSENTLTAAPVGPGPGGFNQSPGKRAQSRSMPVPGGSLADRDTVHVESRRFSRGYNDRPLLESRGTTGYPKTTAAFLAALKPATHHRDRRYANH
jgi:hypothetical protein